MFVHCSVTETYSKKMEHTTVPKQTGPTPLIAVIISGSFSDHYIDISLFI